MKRRLWLGLAAGLLAGTGVGLGEALWVLAGAPTGEYLALVHAAVVYGGIGAVLGLFVGACLALVGLAAPRLRAPLVWSLSAAVVGLAMGGIVVVERVDELRFLGRGLDAATGWGLAGIGALSLVVAVWLGPVLLSRTPLKILIYPRGTIAAWLATAGLSALFAYAPRDPHADDQRVPRRDLRDDLGETPDVLLVTVESWRFDGMPGGAAAGDQPLPALDRLRHEGIWFTQHVAPTSWTRASVASLFTGQLPAAHGCDVPAAQLPADRMTLAEALQERGFVTLGLPARYDLERGVGLEQGFDWMVGSDDRDGLWRSPSGRRLLLANGLRESIRLLTGRAPRRDLLHRPADGLVQDALEVIEDNSERGNRWFVWVHLSDPSLPYFSRDDGADGSGQVVEAAVGSSMQESERALARQLYADELATVDAALGRLLDGLGEERLEDTLIVVVGLHGEELFDHGGMGHGDTLYDEQLRSPLLIRLPGARLGGTQATWQVRTMDVTATILQAVGTEIPAPVMGRDLLGADEVAALAGSAEREVALDRPVAAELYGHGALMEAMRTDGLKLVRANADHPRALPREAVFDLVADPGETTNLNGQVGARQGMLARELRRLLVDGESWRTAPLRSLH
ncbi:MAG: sulfatase [Alphaproteobacteria bacterium]|nr:sulfatase [Alphaproteobacteria bacterium]